MRVFLYREDTQKSETKRDDAFVQERSLVLVPHVTPRLEVKEKEAVCWSV